MSKQNELNLSNLVNSDRAVKMVLLDKNDVVIFQRDLYTKKGDGTLVLLTEDEKDLDKGLAGQLGSMSDADIMLHMHNIIKTVAEKNNIPVLKVALDAALGGYGESIVDDDPCDICCHDCNEDCEHPEKTNEDYDVGTDSLHSDWKDNMEG